MRQSFTFKKAAPITRNSVFQLLFISSNLAMFSNRKNCIAFIFGSTFFLISLVSSDYISNLVTDDDLFQWEAPEDVRKNFTYYWSGYDDEGRPLWIGEVGKWDIRHVAETGGELMKNFDRYIDQLAARVLRSINLTQVQESYVSEFVAVADMDKYNLLQLSSIPTVTYILKKIQALEPALRRMESGYIINTNFVAERLVNLVRPILGPIFERVEVFGSNRGRWSPVLLQKIPNSQLPEWYGGSKEFMPIQVFG